MCIQAFYGLLKVMLGALSGCVFITFSFRFGYRNTSRLGKLIRLGTVILMSFDFRTALTLVSLCLCELVLLDMGIPSDEKVEPQIWPLLVCYSDFLEGYCEGSYLVDPASSHMLVSKIKPCMSKYKQLYSETANGSLYQL